MLRSFDLSRAAAMTGCLLLVWVSALLPEGHGLHDPFHHGEFFAALSRALFAGNLPTPFTLHGLVDILPGLLMYRLVGPDTYMLPTLFVVHLLDFAAAFLLAWLPANWLRNCPGNLAACVAISFAAYHFVSYRDVMLLGSLHLFFAIQRQHPAWRLRLLEVALGLALAFSLLWSLDRGLATILAIGTGCLVQVILRKPGGLALTVCAVAVALAAFSQGLFSLNHYMDSLEFALATSAQWQQPRTFRSSYLVACVVIAYLMSVVATAAWWRRSMAISGDAVGAGVLLLLGLILVRASTNRPDQYHIPAGLWVPMLTIVYVSRPNGTGVDGKINRINATALTVAAALAMIVTRSMALLPATLLALGGLARTESFARHGKSFVTLAVAISAMALGISHAIQINKYQEDGRYTWLNLLASSAKNNAAVSPGVMWAGQSLRNAGANCVFDLANHGLINGSAGLPACTRITYPVYAGPAQEAMILTELQASAPPAIVYSSTHASYRFDGRPMSERLPKLDAWIRDHYPREQCAYGYCIRFIGG